MERATSSIERLNNAAYEAAVLLRDRDPRADYTIGQLPSGSPAQTTDNMVIYRSASGRTYQITLAQLASLIVPTTPTATFTQNSFRNRAINGGMGVDQVNNGASVTASTTGAGSLYGVDRWRLFNTGASATSKWAAQQTAVPQSNGTGSAFATTLSSLSAYPPVAADYMAFYQGIEANNTQDFCWGTTAAKSVAVSFWALASIGGTYSFAIQNAAPTRSYVTTYQLVAGVSSLVTLLIPGDTGGTWTPSGTGGNVFVFFGVGVGSTASTGTTNAWITGNFASASGSTQLVATSGSTLQITDFQIEVGVAATSFEVRPFGTELALSQRYCFSPAVSAIAATPYSYAYNNASTNAQADILFPTTMRAIPTLTANGAAANYGLNTAGTGVVNCSILPTITTRSTPDKAQLSVTVAAGLTAGQVSEFVSNSSAAQLVFRADY